MARESTIFDRMNKAFDVGGKSKYIDDSRYQVTKDESKRRIFIILLISGVLFHLILGMVLYGLTSIASQTIPKGKAIIINGKLIQKALYNLNHFGV